LADTALVNICIGDSETGLVRDRLDNLYEWSLNKIQILKKKAV